MGIVATALKHMLAAGMDHDAIVAAVAEMERDAMPAVDRTAEKRREWDRERKRNQRNSALSGGFPVDAGGSQVDSKDLLSPEGSSPTPPSPKPQSSIPPSPPKGGSSPVEIDQVVSAFSAMAMRSGLSVPRAVTASRRRSLLLRIEEHGLPVVLDAIERIGRSRFCRGENDRGWRADLDFLCQPKSFVSILEGKYDDRPSQQSQAPPRPMSPHMQRQHDIRQKLKRDLYGEPDDEFAGQTVDLGAGDFRSH